MNNMNFISPASSMISSHYFMRTTPVGEESLDLQDSTLKPIEQAAKTSAEHSSLASKQEFYEQAISKESAVQAKQEEVEQQAIKKLSTLDREVRNHERAHAAVGGQYAGAPRYDYEKGPDGVNYAVAGEVLISTGKINGNPELTIEKAQIIRRAALAPAEPSVQDRKIAAEAVQLEAEAHLELLQIEQEQRIEEQRSHEEKIMSQQADSRLHNPPEDDSADVMNQTQEEIFNEINSDLTAQLVALGGAEQMPRSLGSIINRLV
jgi:hypothetical protein